MITGNDPTSIEVLKELDAQSIRVRDIPAKYGITIDQSKKLSRYGKMLCLVNEHLSEIAITNAKALGFKIMALSDLFKQEDWEGLDDILSACDATTTRDTLKRLIDALVSKRETIDYYKSMAELRLNGTTIKKAELEKKAERLKELKESINASMGVLNNYDDATKKFLLEHIGLNGEDSSNSYVLIKRLDSGFMKRLKAIGALKYDKRTYSFLVRDIDLFVTELEKRVKKNSYVYWDYEREYKRTENSRYGPVLNDPYYSKSNKQSLVGDGLLEQMNSIEEEYKKLEEEMKQAEKEVRQAKKENVSSFIDAAIVSDAFSARDIKRHAEIQNKVGRWLFSQGYTGVGFEVTFPNGRRGDVVAFNDDKKIIMVEVKASKSDFTGDRKWQDYLEYCDEFYFCSDQDLTQWANGIEENLSRVNAGYLIVDGRSTQVKLEDCLEHPEIENRDKIILNIATSSAKKMIYGY
ncbi:MmcB family DNA repair protein [Priestia aryabhattai]